MKTPKVEDVKRGISVLWETLRCPICLDLMNNPVSTKCDHQFCKFCMTKLLDCTKRKEANCPICQTKISKRSLQESPGFQRLVEGLQNMIQAFEHDSSTNYFTGMCQQRRQTCVIGVESKTCNGDKVSSIDTSNTDLTGEKDREQNDLPTSLTSTLAAKDDFANLMGLEDSCLFVSDNEGFDSGLGEAPTTTEKEIDFKACSSHTEGQEPARDTDVTHIVEQSTSRSRGSKRITESANPSCQLVLIPEVGENQNVRRSLRNRKKETSTPEKIIDLRQKKSLEKVSEWLMKNSPLEENSEVENVTCASEDSASVAGDFSATTIFPGNLEMMEGGLKREERMKGLEEQVFGAVYRRERRGVLGFSPQNRGVRHTPASHLGVEAQTSNTVPKRQMSRNLKPTDIVKRLLSEEKHEGAFNDQPEEKEKPDIFKESEKPHRKSIDLNQELGSSSTGRLGNSLTELPVEINNEVEGQHEHVPVFDVLRQHGKRISRRKMSDTWQNVDGDLQAQAKTKLEISEKKKMAKKKYEADTDKSVKVPKPLVLVGVGENDCNPIEIPKPGPRVAETAVHIENYPSSEEIGSPNMRQTRRSKRLQHFTEEVQGSHKKPCTGKNMIRHVDIGAADTEHALSSQSIKRNGCVFDEDMGGIENMDSKYTEMTMEKTNTVEHITFSGIPCEANATCSEAMVPCSSSPKTNMPGLKAVDHNNSVIEQSNEEASASEARCVEMEKEEEDINDSELDTEQLVKSFKAIKRKSFRLGSPTVKKSYQKSDMDEQNGTKSKENSLVGSGLEVDVPNTKECSVVQKQLGARIELENSFCSDLIPPSNSPHHILQKPTLRRHRGLTKCIDNRPSIEVEESSNQSSNVVTQENILSLHPGNTVSSLLSTNKVAKSQLPSPHPVNSGPLFPVFGASEEDSPAQTLGSPKQSTENQEQHQLHCSLKKSLERSQNPKSETTVEQQKCLYNTNGNVANSEASLTPDGLMPQISQIVASQAGESGKGSSEASVHILIKSNPKQRRRKTQRLQSSESDCSNEEDELPSLAQIFRRSPYPPEDQACASVVKECSGLSSGQVKDQKTPTKAARVEVTHAAGGLAELDDVPPAGGSSEWVNSSQASDDLFGTPDECSVAVSDTGLSMESSQFSSEIIATQQRIAMQEELKRLEKMMALVSEALQEKETGPNPQLQPQTDSLAGSPGPNLHMNLPCGKEICSRECATDREEDTASMPHGSGASEGLGPTQPGPTKYEGTRGMGRRCRQSQSGRSLRSIHANEIPTPVGPGGKPGEQTTNTSSISLSQSRESKENREDAPSMDTSSTHRLQSDHARVTLVLVPSGLGVNEQTMLKKFAKRIGGRVCSQVTAETTHVIMNTDEQLVCERTLKYFLGIAGRKWVVSFHWISECFKQEKLLCETPYEVRGDVVNGHNHQGPTRSRVTGDSHLLMKDYEIYLQGPFTDMTTGQMEWMVELCGARVVKDPLLFTDKWKSHQVVIVQPGSDLSEAMSYKALQRNATVVTRGWLLDTVATYTIQSFENYKT
ncbi:breast cancer type 1 susceptibility protein homolog [Osmerus mordax]|uniref:breast cancer type 1 susceptibility protein homolog n=1 Tax=Osmerus mordax TaxID=8014 RepID=UPI00350F27B0